MKLAARIALALLCICLGAASASSPTPEQRLDAASALLAQGKHELAASALVALADEAPDSMLAADALFAAAGLFEEKLRQPVRAAKAYRRLIDTYPDSRTALAASRRLKELERNLGPDSAGAAAVTIWNDVMNRFPERPAEQSIQIVEGLIKDHPTWAGRPRAFVWLATLHHRRGEWIPALRRYQQAAAAAIDPELTFEALIGAGMVAIRLERFSEARGYLDKLPFAGAPGRKLARDDAFARLSRARLRARLYTAAYVVVLMVLLGLLAALRIAAGSWRDAARSAATPPLEVVYMAPIGAIFVAVSFTAHFAIAPAVIIITVGSVVVTWLSGAGMRAATSRSRVRGPAHLVGSFAGVIALVYIALHRTRLIDLLIETVRFGPDV